VPEDRPGERATVHRRARRVGSKKGSQADLRMRALAEARPSVLGPAPSPAVPGAGNWVPLGPSAIPKGQTYGGARVLVSGRVTAIAIDPLDPATLYLAAARGGVWKSEDGGVSWTPKSDNEASLAIGALALAPSSPNVLYAGTGEGNVYYYRLRYELSSVNESYEGAGVLKSMDGGDTWTLQGAAEFGGACFFALAVHPADPNTIFAASSRGLHHSTDGGTTWKPLTRGLPAISPSVIAASDIVVDPSSPETVYVAFWGKGVYRTTAAGSADPNFAAVGGLPASLSRISLAIAPSSPATLYAMVADAADGFGGLHRTAGSSPTFASVPLGAGLETYGAYTADIAVDVSTPDVVYMSGVSLYKAVRDSASGSWSLTDVGESFHPDNHALALHPTDHQRIYAGSDGGIYKSSDGGASWDDSINSGLSLAQFEFTDQHPTSAAVVFGGTQDNGTEQFRNSPVFRHSADGDGGVALVDQSDPRNVIHTYYGASPERSVEGGEFGTYAPVSAGLGGEDCLFYPPLVADSTNSQNLAFGGGRLCLDASQGTGGWPTKVALPGIVGVVSAIAYVNSDLIYAGTTSGQAYRAVRAGSTWTATRISATPLPERWIWDVATPPGEDGTVIVVMSGFGAPHVHRGAVAAGGGSATWTDISGTAPNRLPDVPVNSLQIDPAATATMYVGTDVGVFRTTDGGAGWTSFNNGLPNTAIYDLRLHAGSRLLRAATHGRGLWERSVDAASTPKVELFVRDHPMDTARSAPTQPAAAAFADPLQGVALGAYLDWWMCADAKIDSPEGTPPAYQMPVSAVDYLAFESALAHRSVKRGHTNRVYVQVHNRGIAVAEDVTVKALVAAATAGPPELPADFWTRFPLDSLESGSGWMSVGPAKVIPRIAPTQPVVLEWDWIAPLTLAEHSCMLVVVDSAADPIPTAHKVRNVSQLVPAERRVGQRNLHVVDAPPGPLPALAEMLLSVAGSGDRLKVIMPRVGWSLGLLVPRRVAEGLTGSGFEVKPIGAVLRKALRLLQAGWEAGGRRAKEPVFAEPALLTFTHPEAMLERVPASKRGFVTFLVAVPRGRMSRGDANVTFVQESRKSVVGGNTYVLRPAPKPGGRSRPAKTRTRKR
jgi:photosystem II stability/assembly factor-like uncharacterized protein